MRAGQLRHVIWIQTPTSTASAFGTSISWSNLFSTRAAIWPLSSKERLRADKLESLATSKIRIRYRSGISSKNRIKFGDRVFQIIGNPINMEERDIMLDMLVSEVGSDDC